MRVPCCTQQAETISVPNCNRHFYFQTFCSCRYWFHMPDFLFRVMCLFQSKNILLCQTICHPGVILPWSLPERTNSDNFQFTRLRTHSVRPGWCLQWSQSSYDFMTIDRGHPTNSRAPVQVANHPTDHGQACTFMMPLGCANRLSKPGSHALQFVDVPFR